VMGVAAAANTAVKTIHLLCVALQGGCIVVPVR